MRNGWTRRALMLRIDRCYLVAAWTRVTDKRQRYIGLARRYRRMLDRMAESGLAVAAA